MKLRSIGILWCSGNNNQKVHELYESILPNLQNEISCNDKNIKLYLFQIWNFATEMIFRLEPVEWNRTVEITTE